MRTTPRAWMAASILVVLFGCSQGAGGGNSGTGGATGCGDENQTCCSDPSGYTRCNQPGLGCGDPFEPTNACLACGGPGQPCCYRLECEASLKCVPRMPSETDVSHDWLCSHCGDSGEPCCNGSSGCSQGLVCTTRGNPGLVLSCKPCIDDECTDGGVDGAPAPDGSP